MIQNQVIGKWPALRVRIIGFFVGFVLFVVIGSIAYELSFKLYALMFKMGLYSIYWQKSIQRVLQLALTLAAMKLVAPKAGFSTWGFRRSEDKSIIKKSVIFFVLYAIAQALYVLIQRWSGNNLTGGDRDIKNLIFMFAFQGLLTGTCEEPLFRSLIRRFVTGMMIDEERRISAGFDWGTLATAVLFAIAHVNFKILPPSVSSIFWPQVVTALVLGLFYGWAFRKSGSLIIPIIAHNLSNVIIVAAFTFF